MGSYKIYSSRKIEASSYYKLVEYKFIEVGSRNGTDTVVSTI